MTFWLTSLNDRIIKSMDKWRQKRKDHGAKLMTPFVVLWVAVSVGVLIVLWPTDREVIEL